MAIAMRRTVGLDFKKNSGVRVRYATAKNATLQERSAAYKMCSHLTYEETRARGGMIAAPASAAQFRVGGQGNIAWSNLACN